jgi:NAD(P)-dependent dehydrogenase (short-subunit alcohol dehydrogenase family)
LGAAVVTRLLDEGWRVVVPWIVSRELERLPDHPSIQPIEADLFDLDAVNRVVQTATTSPDRPLAAVANLVGGFAMGAKVPDTPIEDFERQFRLNLRPTYLMTAAAIPPMLENPLPHRGAIVCVGSRAALQPFSGAAGYIASKAAVVAFAQAVAAEYKNDGIRCNAILPSTIDTPANRESMPKADHSKWVQPAEIAGVVAHLLSDQVGPTSGAAVPVYGRA